MWPRWRAATTLEPSISLLLCLCIYLSLPFLTLFSLSLSLFSNSTPPHHPTVQCSLRGMRVRILTTAYINEWRCSTVSSLPSSVRLLTRLLLLLSPSLLPKVLCLYVFGSCAKTLKTLTLLCKCDHRLSPPHPCVCLSLCAINIFDFVVAFSGHNHPTTPKGRGTSSP